MKWGKLQSMVGDLRVEMKKVSPALDVSIAFETEGSPGWRPHRKKMPFRLKGLGANVYLRPLEDGTWVVESMLDVHESATTAQVVAELVRVLQALREFSLEKVETHRGAIRRKQETIEQIEEALVEHQELLRALEASLPKEAT